MGLWRMIGVGEWMSDPNTFAASVSYGIPLLLPVSILVKTKLQRYLLLSCFGLAVLCIILTGSRTGMAGLVILVFFLALLSKKRWKFILLLPVVSVIVWSNIPGDLQLRFLTLFDSSLGPINAQQSAESRGEFFWIAMDVWRANPILGVGPDGFRFASGVGQPSHSLYAQVSSNLGLFGVVVFITILNAFMRNFLIGRKVYLKSSAPEDMKFSYYVLVGVTIAVLQLLFLGLGGHNLFRFTWLWYGAFSALALKFIFESQRIEVDEK